MQSWEEKTFWAAGGPEWEGQENGLCDTGYIHVNTYIKNDFR